MHDILRQVVLSRRNEDLCSADHVTAVVGGRCLCAQQTQVGAGAGLGETHRACPRSGRQFGGVELAQLRRCVGHDASIGAFRKSRIQRPRNVAAGQHFTENRGGHHGQGLAAVFIFGAKTRPPAFCIDFVCVPESVGRTHLALFQHAALLVAARVQGCKLTVAEPIGSFDDLIQCLVIDRYRGRMAGERLLDLEHFVQHESNILLWSGIQTVFHSSTPSSLE